MDWNKIEQLLYNPKDLADENLSDLKQLSEKYPASVFPWMLIAGKNVQSGQEIPEDVWQRLLLIHPDKNELYIWRKNGCTFGNEFSGVNTKVSEGNVAEKTEKPEKTSTLKQQIPPDTVFNIHEENKPEANTFIPEIIGFSWEYSREISSDLPEKQSEIQTQTIKDDPVKELSEQPAGVFDLTGYIDHIGFETDNVLDLDLTKMVSEISPTLAKDHFREIQSISDEIKTEIMEEGDTTFEGKVEVMPDKETSFTDWLKQVSGKATTAHEWNMSKTTGKKKKSGKKKAKDKNKVMVKGDKVLRKDEPDASDKLKKKKKKKAQLKEIIESSIQYEGGLVSETFAGLLVKQGHIERAIEMYEKLILIKPEKSSYFAARIKELKNK